MQLPTSLAITLSLALSSTLCAAPSNLLRPLSGSYEYQIDGETYSGPTTSNGEWYGQLQYWHADEGGVNVDYTFQATYPFAYLTTYVQQPVGDVSGFWNLTTSGGVATLREHPVYALRDSKWWLDSVPLVPGEPVPLSPGNHTFNWTGSPGTFASLLYVEVPEPSTWVLLGGGAIVLAGLHLRRVSDD